MQADVARWQEKLAGEQVVSAAALAYVEAQRSASVVEAAQSDADLAKTLLHQTQDQHHAGTATGVDEARAQTRLAQEEVRLIRAHVDARQAAIRLARVTGISLQDTLKLTDALASVPLDTATLVANIPFAWEHRFEMQVAQAQLRADEESWRAAQAEFLPTIKAAGDYGFSGNLPEGSARTGSIRGQLDLPIFSGGSTTAEIRENRARKTAAEANVADTRNQIEEDVDISHDTLAAAVDELHATDLEVQLSTRELQLAHDRFSAGVGDNIELLSAQTALEQARESQINALAGYHVARINWALALGTVSAFHL
jgi:outer membrane protein TolC